MMFDLRKYFDCDQINFVYGPYFKLLNNKNILGTDGKKIENIRYYNFLENNVTIKRHKLYSSPRSRFVEINDYINGCYNHLTESVAKKLNPSNCNVFIIRVSEGPDWWLEGIQPDASRQKNIFEIIKEKIPKFFYMLKKKNMHLLIDQAMEGFPLNMHYNYIHNYFEKERSNISKLHFVTSNLYEQKIYNDWKQKNNKTVGFNIVAKPWFTQMGWNVARNKVSVEIQKKFKFDNANNIKLFNCLNRRGRPDRVRFLNYLNYYNLLKNNLVSAGDECKHFEVPDKESIIDVRILNKNNQKNFCDKVPLVLDNSNFQINFAGNLNLDIYFNSWFTITSETFVTEHTGTSMFFSEKTFKPIATCSPFIMVAAPKSLENLKKLGYETFHDIIDESYDNILDRPKRFSKICDILVRLNRLTPQQLYNMYCKVGDILQHNQYVWFKSHETNI